MAKTITKNINLVLTAGTPENGYANNYAHAKHFLLDEIEENHAIRITYTDKYNDGTYTKRFFASDYNIGVFDGKSRRHGRVLFMNDLKEIVSLDYPIADTTSKADKLIATVNKFKKLLANKRHPNLWQDLQKDYRAFDTNEYLAIYNNLEDKQSFISKEMQALYDYEQQKGFRLLHDGYKTTTIKSHKPTAGGWSEYNNCLANIKKHIDNKENFDYYWQSGYDIHVGGKQAPDGSYRAWLSAEYRNCGNGHYYLLINDNTAIFDEDD